MESLATRNRNRNNGGKQPIFHQGVSSSTEQSIESRASSSKQIISVSSQKCSREVEEQQLRVNAKQVKQLDERLRFLEEEIAILKAAFWETIEERNRLMAGIYKEMQAIHNYLRDQKREQKFSSEVSIFKSAKDRQAGILQVLCQDSNPLLVMRNVRAKAAEN